MSNNLILLYLYLLIFVKVIKNTTNHFSSI